MWLRLDVDFDQSEWIAFLPKLSQMAWIDLLRHVKQLSSRQGKVKLRSVAVWAKAWGYDSSEPVQRMLDAAKADGAIAIDGEDLTVKNWHRYQEPSTIRAEKSRTKADCNTEQHIPTHSNIDQIPDTSDPRPLTYDNHTPVKRERYRSLETYPEQIQKGALWFIEQVKALFPNIRIEANEQAFYLEKLVSVKGADGNQLWTLTQFKEVIAHIHSVNYDNKAFAWARNILSIAKLMKRKDGITYMERLWNEYKLARS